MDNKIVELLSEEIRETKRLTLETRRMADAAQQEAKAALTKADAAWELVVITRNQIDKPIWRKLFGF